MPATNFKAARDFLLKLVPRGRIGAQRSICSVRLLDEPLTSICLNSPAQHVLHGSMLALCELVKSCVSTFTHPHHSCQYGTS